MNWGQKRVNFGKFWEILGIFGNIWEFKRKKFNLGSSGSFSEVVT